MPDKPEDKPQLCGSCGYPLPHTHESEWLDTRKPKDLPEK